MKNQQQIIIDLNINDLMFVIQPNLVNDFKLLNDECDKLSQEIIDKIIKFVQENLRVEKLNSTDKILILKKKVECFRNENEIENSIVLEHLERMINSIHAKLVETLCQFEYEKNLSQVAFGDKVNVM